MDHLNEATSCLHIVFKVVGMLFRWICQLPSMYNYATVPEEQLGVGEFGTFWGLLWNESSPFGFWAVWWFSLRWTAMWAPGPYLSQTAWAIFSIAWQAGIWILLPKGRQRSILLKPERYTICGPPTNCTERVTNCEMKSSRMSPVYLKPTSQNVIQVPLPFLCRPPPVNPGRQPADPAGPVPDSTTPQQYQNDPAAEPWACPGTPAHLPSPIPLLTNRIK